MQHVRVKGRQHGSSSASDCPGRRATSAVGRGGQPRPVTGARHRPRPHPAQGGWWPWRGGLDRYGHHGSPGGEPHDHLQGAPGIRGGGVGGDRTSPTARHAPAQAGRGQRGASDRVDLLHPAGGPCPLGLTAARGPLRAARWGGCHLPRAGAAGFKKSQLKPWLRECWVIPPKATAAFVAAMEDVLEVYTRPYDPRFPQVCMDESSKQLLAEVREPLPQRPATPEHCGTVRREDYEYER